jgi:hypothetical protein
MKGPFADEIEKLRNEWRIVRSDCAAVKQSLRAKGCDSVHIRKDAEYKKLRKKVKSLSVKISHYNAKRSRLLARDIAR